MYFRRFVLIVTIIAADVYGQQDSAPKLQDPASRPASTSTEDTGKKPKQKYPRGTSPLNVIDPSTQQPQWIMNAVAEAPQPGTQPRINACENQQRAASIEQAKYGAPRWLKPIIVPNGEDPDTARARYQAYSNCVAWTPKPPPVITPSGEQPPTPLGSRPAPVRVLDLSHDSPSNTVDKPTDDITLLHTRTAGGVKIYTLLVKDDELIVTPVTDKDKPGQYDAQNGHRYLLTDDKKHVYDLGLAPQPAHQ